MPTRFALPARFALMAGLALSACADPGFRGVPEVRVASPAEVSQCRLLSTITNEPGLYGPVLGREAERYARNKVLESARSEGADTVVFEGQTPGEPAYVLVARAYDC